MILSDLSGKTYLVVGIANKKSVAFRIAKLLIEEGATVICSVRSKDRAESVAKLLPNCQIEVCDVEHDNQIKNLANRIGEKHPAVHGIVHSVAFASYESFSGKFEEVSRKDFLQCVSVSCYSLIAIANAMKPHLDDKASVVTISISTTRMAVESYGYMAPAKAALDSAIAFLAKAFSRDSEVRFNGVNAGLLKTSASAGIPGYADSYMYAEQVIPRKRGLETDEVANTALFLLSNRSSGINAQGLVVDAGMSINYFDNDLVKHTLQGVWPTENR